MKKAAEKREATVMFPSLIGGWGEMPSFFVLSGFFTCACVGLAAYARPYAATHVPLAL
jgi:hypothetical protein